MIRIVTKPAKVLQQGKLVSCRLVFWITANNSKVYLGKASNEDEAVGLARGVLKSNNVHGLGTIEHH